MSFKVMVYNWENKKWERMKEYNGSWFPHYKTSKEAEHTRQIALALSGNTIKTKLKKI